MRPRRTLAPALVSAAALAFLSLATPASASVPGPAARVPGGDPAGANGTVKIDGKAFDDGIDNEPHVTCDFRINFFNFDDEERANIVFTVHPPTGSGTELLRRDNVLVSDDPAGGGAPDPDKTFAFSATELGLAAYPAHAKQGYHVKLTIERIGAPGAGKHKVFWIEACAQAPGTSPAKPREEASETPGTVGNGGGAGNDGSLAITGPGTGRIAMLGMALVAAGAILLMVFGRRRTTTTG